MVNEMLIVVRTARHRYAVRRGDVFDIKLVTSTAALESGGLFDRPALGVELGPLLDPADHTTQTRRQALVVSLRRRYVALLVDYVEDLLEQFRCAPLPALLAARLGQPWAIGALALENDLIVQLDLREIARGALLSQPRAIENKTGQ